MKTLSLFGVFLMISPLSAEEAKWKIRKDLQIYDAVVSNTRIRVVISEQAFDPSKHRIDEGSNSTHPGDSKSGIPTIDHKAFVGGTFETEGKVPPPGSPQLAEVAVYFGETKVEVPTELVSNVFFARFQKPGVFSTEYTDSIVSISADAQCVQISFAVGEAGGQAKVFYAVTKDGKATESTPTWLRGAR